MSDARIAPGGLLDTSPRYVQGPELTAQRIAVRLQTFKGEWILDPDAGMDYAGILENMQQNQLSAFVDAAVFEIQNTPGVASVIVTSSSRDDKTLRATFQVELLPEGAQRADILLELANNVPRVTSTVVSI